MKKFLIALTLLTTPLCADDILFDIDLDPTDMPEEIETRAVKPQPIPSKPIVIKRKSKNAATEHAIAQDKVAGVVDKLFEQYMKIHNLNPACVEQFMKKDLVKAKQALVSRLHDGLEKSYRSEHLFSDVDALVKEFFKTFVTRAHIVLSQAWVLSVIDDSGTSAEKQRTSSNMRYSKKTKDLYNQLTLSRAKKAKK